MKSLRFFLITYSFCGLFLVGIVFPAFSQQYTIPNLSKDAQMIAATYDQALQKLREETNGMAFEPNGVCPKSGEDQKVSCYVYSCAPGEQKKAKCFKAECHGETQGSWGDFYDSLDCQIKGI